MDKLIIMSLNKFTNFFKKTSYIFQISLQNLVEFFLSNLMIEMNNPVAIAGHLYKSFREGLRNYAAFFKPLGNILVFLSQAGFAGLCKDMAANIKYCFKAMPQEGFCRSRVLIVFQEIFNRDTAQLL